MAKNMNWKEFQGVSVVSFDSKISNSELIQSKFHSCSEFLIILAFFLTEIAERSQNIESFKFSEDGIQKLDLSDSEFRLPSLEGQKAVIKNKYYEACLYFIDLDKNIPLELIPEDYLQATIVYFDNNDKESFEYAKSYVVQSNIFLDDSSVKLFVCNTAKEFDCKFFFVCFFKNILH